MYSDDGDGDNDDCCGFGDSDNLFLNIKGPWRGDRSKLILAFYCHKMMLSDGPLSSIVMRKLGTVKIV